MLACTQALAGANNTVLLATGAIAGALLAPDKIYATVPISVYVIGLWLGTLPIGWLARHYGRRTAFQVGTVFGVVTGLICCLAVLQGSFLIFNIGAFFSGLYAAAHQAYRFRRRRHGERGFPAQGYFLGADRRNLRGHDRRADS